MSETRQAIRSEPRGSHWVARLDGTDADLPAPVVMVGKTQEEAETRLRQWLAARHDADSRREGS